MVFARLMNGMQIAVTGMTFQTNGGMLLMTGIMLGAMAGAKIGKRRQPGANAVPGAQQKCEH